MLGNAGAILRQRKDMKRSPWRYTKNIHQYHSCLDFYDYPISSSCILHLLNDSYYINLQLSKMREKVQAVNNPMQYLNTLTWQSLCPPLVSLLYFGQGLKGEFVLLLVQLLCMLSHCRHASQVQRQLSYWGVDGLRRARQQLRSFFRLICFCFLLNDSNRK